MMKRFIVSLLSILLPVLAFCQPIQPISWKLNSQKLKNGQYEITATASANSSEWHIYDMKEYDGGPNSTVFSLSGEGFEPVGEAKIVSPVHTAYDGIFEMEIGTCETPVVIKQTVNPTRAGKISVEVTVEWQACDDHRCLPPNEYSETLTIDGPKNAASASSNSSRKSIWALILEAIAWGFVALLTPCVFPMIPMTVSFFLKQKGKMLALIFGLSIIVLYTVPIAVLILISLLTGGEAVTADIFNWIATHWLPNIIFFVIFMAFAASFFGAFEITLPSSMVNKSDSKSYQGGLAGTFFVALTLVLVSFSCTGPIVGSVLIKSTQGQFWEPIITMLAFSTAFALPFTIFAFAPSLLQKMPRSGGWLNSVKVVLGFIELALGMKFLSVADQTYHWGILPREVYLAIWIVIFTLLGFYLLGKIRFKNDSPLESVSVFRLFLAIASFSFVVWMVPGMFGAPLKALSGYLPPITTQEFVLSPGSSSAPATTITVGETPSRKYSDFLKMPYGIEAFYDYDEAIEYAAKTGKPVFVDFTGHGCVNCREMESRVWSDPRALKMLKEDYVVCSLFADDKKIVDEADWVTLPNGKVLKSLGKINSHFALTRFNVNAQPYYAILDPHTEEHKVPSRGYDLDVDAFVSFLEAGLK